MLRKPSLVLLLIPFVVGGCASWPGEEVAVSSDPDPREENAWFAAGRRQIAASAPLVAGRPTAKNVILFVGDGMGISTVTAARILEGQRQGATGEEHRLSFDTFQLVLSHAFKSSQIGRCYFVVAAADATSDCRRFVRHADSMAQQLAAGAGAIWRHRAHVHDRLCGCV